MKAMKVPDDANIPSSIATNSLATTITSPAEAQIATLKTALATLQRQVTAGIDTGGRGQGGGQVRCGIRGCGGSGG